MSILVLFYGPRVSG